MNKKIVMMTAMALAATVAFAQARSARSARKAAAAVSEDAPTTGKEAKILIDQFPKLGNQATLSAPAVQGGSVIGSCYAKPRKWIVLEAKYSTFAKWQEQLTFTWHVLLDSKTATENKGNREGLSPFSYFTTSTTYQNIPMGTHAASVCLHPSYLERYGQPKAVGLVITNAKGEILQGDSDGMVGPIKPHMKWWEDRKIMDDKQADGKPTIEHRQGLQDRSKTIWALVNPNDYEQVAQ